MDDFCGKALVDGITTAELRAKDTGLGLVNRDALLCCFGIDEDDDDAPKVGFALKPSVAKISSSCLIGFGLLTAVVGAFGPNDVMGVGIFRDGASMVYERTLPLLIDEN